MKHALPSLLAVMIASALINLSCSKEHSCENCNSNNRPPIADAGQDQTIRLPLQSTVLNGTASSDPDGKITGWTWRKISGPASCNFSRIDSAATVVSTLVQGLYQFELTVTDDKRATAKDTVQVVVADANTGNRPPVACAGEDQVIDLPLSNVMLNGSCSSDPDNNIAGYQWSNISGPAACSLASPNMVETQVSNLTAGTYLFQLKVTDAGGLTSLDTVQVMVRLQTDPSNVDVYVAGDAGGVATYWKNGIAVTLKDESFESGATAIAVVGNDVYVAGWEGDAFMYKNNRAKYWKNGEQVILTGTTGAGATSIAVAGNDVYVAGWEFKGAKTVAKYWKNGQAFNLTDGSADAEATGVVISNGDVYVAGHDNGIAKYWKNNQAVSLTDGAHQAYANAIAVVGNDVYVAGSEENGTSHVAKYWKNGQAVTLTNGSALHATANSIAVAGTDVFVAGWEGDFYGRVGATGAVARYWKNGHAVSLTNGQTFAYASALALYGNNIYVAGVDINSNAFDALYWKNAQRVSLQAPQGGWARSIIVVPR